MAIAGFYWVVFAAFAIPAALLEFDHGSGLFGSGKGGAAGARAGGRGGGPEYVRFKNNYLIVFALMMGEGALSRRLGSSSWQLAVTACCMIQQQEKAVARPRFCTPCPRRLLNSTHRHHHHRRRPSTQPATGCRAPTSTTSTSITASACAT
jgi:hypothetical protein